MSYLKDSQALRSRRDGFILSMQRGAMPAMCKMKLWAELKNAIIYEVVCDKLGRERPEGVIMV